MSKSFWNAKNDIKKNKNLPWQHWANVQRHSEYWKLLRNKQVLKRTYLLKEKRFMNLVTNISQKYSKNKDISHDKSLMQFLERRCDVVILRSWFAKTIMQARQMVVHGHFLLNWKKHNVPSYFLKESDVLSIVPRLKNSSLYSQISSSVIPSWLKVNKSDVSLSLLSLPLLNDENNSFVIADVLNVIEFYARN